MEEVRFAPNLDHKFIWQGVCPHKIELFVWQLLKGRVMVQEISHLQFADDTILFLKPRLEYLRNVKRILRCFELATRLRINFFKSCLVQIGPNVPQNVEWAEVFHCRYAALPTIYLGLPLARDEVAWALVEWETKIKLKDLCPKIYALAIQKHGVVNDFGNWYDNRWSWEVLLHRPMFDWEKDQWEVFVSVLDCLVLRKTVSDAIVWFGVDHLFLMCSWSWKLWNRCMDWWDMGQFWKCWDMGVLRDNVGKVWGLFSVFVGRLHSNAAEILAIHRVVSMCAQSQVFVGKEIDIVSDSKVTVSWVNSKGFGNLKHIHTIYDIRNSLKILDNTRVIFISRASNSFADLLAKKGQPWKGIE
ncbi:hypothetical protein Dsin_013643 [Dipteronia sinensis]|uniref:RNase H type-1 domain-containing protein n=1 Tax=Dipteronia sinensis TaxID=43782 RepID=A0AAE0AKD0_9ROSI|nr:hypothetical protein Dsin_013643 [Dipteronia sinensis]